MINANIFIETSTVKNEVINLFINENTKFTHLYIPHKFNYQIHLIPGTDHCFSELEFLSCNTCITDNALNGLTEICKSIKVLELIEVVKSNYGIVKLIEAPKRLFTIRLITENCRVDEPFYKILENSFTKHANFIQDFITNKSSISNILSSFLESLKLFFDNWKGRHPMLLQTIQYNKNWDEPFDLIEKYKVEGIIKKYDHVLNESIFEDFEWIEQKF
ncbi:unnamed protein product [Rhizophagus irregularis]|nr:unnamed protein product [Rhizophagus irregularis]CAB5393512.1 unnamed protein product [Rhizophagus irregularis]